MFNGKNKQLRFDIERLDVASDMFTGRITELYNRIELIDNQINTDGRSDCKYSPKLGSYSFGLPVHRGGIIPDISQLQHEMREMKSENKKLKELLNEVIDYVYSTKGEKNG